jgi:hypothetical protein
MTSVTGAAEATHEADVANRIAWTWRNPKRCTLQTSIEATTEQRHGAIHLRVHQCTRRRRSSPEYNNAPATSKTVNI